MRCPHLGVFLSIGGVSEVATLGRCPLREVPLYKNLVFIFQVALSPARQVSSLSLPCLLRKEPENKASF